MAAVGGAYAKAFFSLANSVNKVEDFKEQLGLVVKIKRESTAFGDFLHHPEIKKGEKKRLLAEVLSEVLSPLVMNFFFLLIDDGVERFLEDVFREYVDLYRKYKAFQVARVITAVELTPDEEKALKDKLEEKYGKKIIIKKEVNPEIIGGLIVKMGFQVIDVSIRTSLEYIKAVIEW
ncbi:MAG: F-type H+-transporting ATPase subunit delta [Tepidanaerobacteraceae bacterium]|nr:F-type H+-transporting ATPase subunit delta [Tepidanaerobacteraceae bacterium]